MKKQIIGLGLLVIGIWMGISFAWAVKPGDPAPDFKARDSNGKTQQLSHYKEKFVVLEWHNKDCPFVQSQYKGKMEKLQQEWTKKGVIWFIVNSSAPGRDGYVTGTKANLDVKRHGAVPTAVLMDPSGEVGHAFGAKTTPHMFVIGPQGTVLYNGAVDNAPLEDGISSRTQEGKPYINYVDQALQEAARGAEVSIKSTVPYGCSVKYK